MKTAENIIETQTKELTRLVDFLRQNCPRCRQLTVPPTVLQVLKTHPFTATQRGYRIEGDRVMYGEFEVKVP